MSFRYPAFALAVLAVPMATRSAEADPAPLIATMKQNLVALGCTRPGDGTFRATALDYADEPSRRARTITLTLAYANGRPSSVGYSFAGDLHGSEHEVFRANFGPDGEVQEFRLDGARIDINQTREQVARETAAAARTVADAFCAGGAPTGEAAALMAANRNQSGWKP
jgi:hypothetical protein